jgi:hypothetical protein
MVAYKPYPPYRERILAYCEKNNVVVPHDFDITKSSEKYALIDITEEPHTLVSRSTYLENEIITFLQKEPHKGRQYRILDFKRCCELHLNGSKRLKCGETFSCKLPREEINAP